MRRPLQILIANTFLMWIGTRMTAVALPLVALTETGEAWTTGLVGAFAGLPLLTVGWWGRRLRDRLTSGRALAALMLVQAAGLVIVPVTTLIGQVGPVALCASGVVTGAAGALLGPSQRALISDLADAGAGPGTESKAPQWLAWQDVAHRISMIFAPPAGAWLVVVWGAVPLLWLESILFVVGAVAMLGVPAAGSHADQERGRQPASAPVSAMAVLRAYPQVAAGILMAGVGGVSWFGFTLGLAILGAELDMPGALIAAGMSGYGATSVLTSLLVPFVINRLPPMATMVTSWLVLGSTFVILPAVVPNLIGIAVVAGVGGAAMPWGIAALNTLISRSTAGGDRRAAFTVQTVVHAGGASLGLLVGGGIIGWAGAGPVLIVTGLLQILAATTVLLLRTRIRHGARLGRAGPRHHSQAPRPAPATIDNVTS